MLAGVTSSSQPQPPPQQVSSPDSSPRAQWWQQRNIFLIALGADYFGAVDWPRLMKNLLRTNPGYSLYVYGNEEVQTFLEVCVTACL